MAFIGKEVKVKVASYEEMVADMERGVFDYTVDGECSSCGNCCSNFLPLTNGEVNRIARYIKANRIAEQKHITAPMSLENYDGVYDATCPFRDNINKKCTIYEIRPAICRDFRCDKPKNKDYGTNKKVYRNGTQIVFMRETFFQNVK